MKSEQSIVGVGYAECGGEGRVWFMLATSPDATQWVPTPHALPPSLVKFLIFSHCYLPCTPLPSPYAAPLKPFFSNPILILQNGPPSKVVKDAQSFPDAPGPLFSLTKENAG